MRYKDPTGHDRVDYAEGILEESTNVLKNSVKSTAYTALLGPARLPVQSTIGMIDALSNPKKAFNQITEKYRNLANEDEHVRDNAAGKVTVAAAETLFNFLTAKKLGISNSNRPAKGPWYRYIGEGEKKIIDKTGKIPNIDAGNLPKPVHFTNRKYETAGRARIHNQLENKPSYRVEIDPKNVKGVSSFSRIKPTDNPQWGKGGGVEATTRHKIPVDQNKITKLKGG